MTDAPRFPARPGSDHPLDPADFETRFELYHELMARKVGELLLVSCPYDAFILEEDGSLASKIINEYRGLNLSRPPRLTKASSGEEALRLLRQQDFDLVIAMPNLVDMETVDLALRIKEMAPTTPVILLAHSPQGLYPEDLACPYLDRIFIWTGDADLLLALVKSTEDRLNAPTDTEKGMVRVLILVEDSPLYRSFFLPLIYKVVVKQVVDLLAESLTEAHRLLKMRARPKVLVAENYEEAKTLFEQYQPYVLGVFSDTRFPRDCQIIGDAGFVLLSRIKKEVPHLPLLLLSSEPENQARAERIGAAFLDKNCPDLLERFRHFFLSYLGFGDFVFCRADKTEIGRAGNLHELERLLPRIPDEPLLYHARRNHFSNWLMARSEVALASEWSRYSPGDFESPQALRDYLIASLRALRHLRQKGVVARFHPRIFDREISDFLKLGQGSLGGKARGLAFIAHLLHQQQSDRAESFPKIEIGVPKTLVLTTEIFERFLAENGLDGFDPKGMADPEIEARFLAATMPKDAQDALASYLSQVTVPLSVRSSSLLEDAHVQAYAGLYRTYILPNNGPDRQTRLSRLLAAIQSVYASVFFRAPRRFSRHTAHQFQKDSMAVILQELVGSRYGDFFYPAISGVARSHNFYPFGNMTPEDGVAHIALGLGRILEGESGGLRFCPRHPHILPQFSTVEETLENSQRFFYALRMEGEPANPLDPEKSLARRELDEAGDEFPVRSLSSRYLPEEDRIRDSGYGPGARVLTFAPVLKYKRFPLAGLLSRILELGHQGMGGPVEVEFAVELAGEGGEAARFYPLQIRPMNLAEQGGEVRVTEADIREAICFSGHAVGNGRTEVPDLIYVKPEAFAREATPDIAAEISRINAELKSQGRSYFLIGPGRWGTTDRWLGIPVRWADISAVAGMVELSGQDIPADPSRGSHFFRQITEQGVHYLTLLKQGEDRMDWERLTSVPLFHQTRFLGHIRRHFLLKNDGRRSRSVILMVSDPAQSGVKPE